MAALFPRDEALPLDYSTHVPLTMSLSLPLSNSLTPHPSTHQRLQSSFRAHIFLYLVSVRDLSFPGSSAKPPSLFCASCIYSLAFLFAQAHRSLSTLNLTSSTRLHQSIHTILKPFHFSRNTHPAFPILKRIPRYHIPRALDRI